MSLALLPQFHKNFSSFLQENLGCEDDVSKEDRQSGMFSSEEMQLDTGLLQRCDEPGPRRGILGDDPNLSNPSSLPVLGKGQRTRKTCRAEIADARGQAIGKKRDVRITVCKMDEVTRGGHSAEHLLMKLLWIYK